MNLPETEGPMRGWLRGKASIATLIGDRVYFAPPEQDALIFPFIVMYRVGGSPDSHGQDYPSFIFECWGDTKYQASQLAGVVSTEVQNSQESPPVVIGTCKIVSGEVNSVAPIGGGGKAKRYRVDATFHMRAV